MLLLLTAETSGALCVRGKGAAAEQRHSAEK